jgi:site-specific DNA-methyltransferase (adenine-specific)
MDFMAGCKDNAYDLAIVDPPYGIGASKQTKSISKLKNRKSGSINRGHHKSKEWDNEIPKKEYFEELFRVSKHQIIWGGNYMTKYLYHSSSWIFWYKFQSLETRADGELAWSSFKRPMKVVELKHDGFKKGAGIGRNSKVIHNVPFSGSQTIHPTQKPIQLYKWLLKNYAKKGDKILDTHGGSMSSAIACHDMGFDLDIIELDKDYYNAAKLRYENHTQQIIMF